MASNDNESASSSYPTVQLVKYNVKSRDPVKCYPPRKLGEKDAWDRYCVYPLETISVMPKKVQRVETGLMVKSFPSDDYYLALTANEWAIRKGIVVLNTFQDDVLRVYPSDIMPIIFNTSQFTITLEPTDYYFELRLMPKNKFNLTVDPYEP